MVLVIENILSAKTLEILDELFDKGVFEEGGKTASWGAKGVKNNLQASRDKNPKLAHIDELVLRDLYSNEQFVGAVFAKSVSPFLYAKSMATQGYGWHVDNAFMGHDVLIRSDISCSVGVNDCGEYEGGDLILEDTPYRLKRGSVIVYPSYVLHKVDEVTRGERRVCVTWMQSLVREASKRQILVDLDACRKRAFKRDNGGEDFNLINKSYMNLLRIWGEP